MEHGSNTERRRTSIWIFIRVYSVFHPWLFLLIFRNELSHFLIKLVGVVAALFEVVDPLLGSFGEKAARVILGQSVVVLQGLVHASETFGGIVAFGNARQCFFGLGSAHERLRGQDRVVGAFLREIGIQLPSLFDLRNGRLPLIGVQVS